MLRRFLNLFLLAFLLLTPGGCQQPPPPEATHITGQTMGTTWSLAMFPDSAAIDTQVLKQQLQKRLDHINALMSTYDPTSEISRFNNLNSTDWFPISQETARVIALSLQISALTDGAFDISVGPLVELWGFGAAQREENIPSETEIETRLALVGYKNIQLRREPAAIRKQIPGLRIDLSAVAKGYAVDALAELLNNQGITNYIVEIGGELQVSGRHSDGTPWRIAIEEPLEGTREVDRIFPLTGTALATSGNYRNFYIVDGQRYAHTIDPVSGKPILHKLASVTVLDPSCARADALATALMVLGEEKGRQFCEKNRIAAYLLIHDKTKIKAYATPAFEAFIKEAEK